MPAAGDVVHAEVEAAPVRQLTDASPKTFDETERELIERFRFVLVGTIRSDGTPRISPVEAHIVGGHLMLVMIPGTLKARDLLRDPRMLINSPITHPDDPNTEFKLRGRVVEIRDQALREATADAIETASGWRPPAGWHFFSLDIEEAALLAWQSGMLDLTRWNADRGLDSVRRPTAVLDEPRTYVFSADREVCAIWWKMCDLLHRMEDFHT